VFLSHLLLGVLEGVRPTMPAFHFGKIAGISPRDDTKLATEVQSPLKGYLLFSQIIV
jgi:hypothetical protein